jgi:amino acid transporter
LADEDRVRGHEPAGEQDQEGPSQRLSREHNELLQELRALIPGAQVLFAFLLVVQFSDRFGRLDDSQRYIYYATLVCTALALVLFLAPAAHHRLRFREGDKDYMLRKGNREAIAGSVAMALAFTGVVYLITDLSFGTPEAIVAASALFAITAWRWWVLALYRSIKVRSGHS